MKNLIYPQDNAVINTYTEIQNKFIESIKENGIDSALEWLLPLKKNDELSKSKSICFTWDESTSPYVFELSEDATFSVVYSVCVNENKLKLSNFKIGQKYYWRVNNGNVHTFETLNNSYRFIDIEGALNVRDIGGINIKQGLVYRGSEIETLYKISDEGKSTFVDLLKIETEVDLRVEGDKCDRASFAGERVRYKCLPYRPYLEIFEDIHKKELFDIMEFLSDEKNYPVYFHCLGGADRTGMLAMYLRAIAGESDEDILIDYELTSLSNYAYGLTEGVGALGFRSRNADYFVGFLERLKAYQGKNLSQNIVSFILDCCVKPETIEKIRMIILK